MELTSIHAVGMAVAMLAVFGIGIYSGRKVHTAVDFSVSGRRAGSFLVMGTILGTLVGGASTIGTAQLAYIYGFSAWWFTLGGGIGCLIIAIFLVKPMRETRFETIPRFISSSYGTTAGVLAALFVSLGMFINIVPQVFSSVALLSSMFAVDLRLAALITVILAVMYVVFGGAWGTGLMGVTKIMLTCFCMIAAGTVALFAAGGPAGLTAYFPAYPWFSLFGRGINTDLAAAFSLMVGVLSSQIYFQGVFCSRDLKAARGGALLSALLAPAIGLGGILVGLFMRMHYPDINPAQALPLFVINYLPAWFAGIVLATLLLAAIGTGAGLTLGVSTMLNRDIFLRLRPDADDRQVLMVFRILIITVMAVALAVVLLVDGNVLILSWSYFSLGLRGATIFFPLLAVIFFKGKISPAAGTLAVIAGPLIVITGTFLNFGLNPLYPGLAVSFIILLVDYLRNKSQGNHFEPRE
ncbi:MAG: sodium:solute symporter family protein [Bacillota bacterium]|nr:sodium:solute symporter family protein [Bacillota bacterium]